MTCGHCCPLVSKSCPTPVTPWTAAHQAPLSMGSPGKDTGVRCQFLLQGIFLTRGLNPDLCIGRFFTTEPAGKPHLQTLSNMMQLNLVLGLKSQANHL